MREYMRGAEEQRKIGGRMRHGKKRERAAAGGESRRECATVRMKIYKYVRFKGRLGDGELRKERKQKKEEKEEGVGERREEEKV